MRQLYDVSWDLVIFIQQGDHAVHPVDHFAAVRHLKQSHNERFAGQCSVRFIPRHSMYSYYIEYGTPFSCVCFDFFARQGLTLSEGIERVYL